MKSILLIEDEFIIAKDIKITLEKNSSYKVETASNCHRAFELFNNNKYDLIICDINLNSEKDGIELVKEFNKTKIVPVIYLTAYSEHEIVQRAQNSMPFAYLLKPFNETQLKVTIQLALLNSTIKTSDINLENNEKLTILTSREKEILTVLALGKTSKEIGNLLNISSLTVDKHKRNIKEKLAVNTIGELVNFAITSKLHSINA